MERDALVATLSQRTDDDGGDVSAAVGQLGGRTRQDAVS